MPELPEVETTCRGIKPHIERRTIADVVIRQPRLRWPVSEEIKRLLPGLTVHEVSRRAKYILLVTDIGTVIMHLGMSGNLRILTGDAAVKKHDHADVVFTNGTVLRFNDPRRFGAILWSGGPISEHPLFKDLGPEPLSSEFDGNYLRQRAKNRNTPIKAFIMDSHNVVGVGNIYANEALFAAGIRPTRSAGNISSARYETLATSIREVLSSAIDQGGTTLRDFVNENGKPGYFKQRLQVYGRGGAPCFVCRHPLTEIRQSNRSTVFCSRCQR
ncbi:MAG: bifunctional DNA-formamidopyrimidine glycosylase/DNA-(apurinic or apyrimidinic site) lyase [Gammaproteobacteria bacterium]